MLAESLPVYAGTGLENVPAERLSACVEFGLEDVLAEGDVPGGDGAWLTEVNACCDAWLRVCAARFEIVVCSQRRDLVRHSR